MHLERVFGFIGQHRGRASILCFAFAGLLLAACNGLPLLGESAQPPPPTSTPIPTAPAVARPTYLVQRGDVQELLTFSGRWQPRDQLPLSFEINGTVRRVDVRRGDTVRAGQLLADYQITDLENQLASAELELETALANLTTGEVGSLDTVAAAEIRLANAKLRLQEVRAGSPWTQVASARINLDDAQRALEAAQRSYDDAVSRPEQPASVSDSAYKALVDARSRLKSAQISYDQAAQNFNNYQFSVYSAENSVIEAELALAQAKAGGADANKQQAVRAAQLRLDQVKENIARSSLYAPIDGEVLEVNIKPGDQVSAFSTVITIGRSEPKEIVASIAISDINRLSVGLVGICQVLNRPETAVECVVRRLPTSARDADQTTRIAASLEWVEGLVTGQLIEVWMPLQVREDVLWLPPAAIRTFQNRTFVVLQTPDGPRSVDVEIGLQTTDRIEIVSGVAEGDVVIGP